jgi:hypothetical protein
MTGRGVYPELYQFLPAAHFVYVVRRALTVYYAHTSIHPLRAACIYHVVIAPAIAMVYSAFEYETHRRETAVRMRAYASMFCIYMLRNFQVCMVQQEKRIYLFCLAGGKRLPDGHTSHIVGFCV